MLTLAINTAEDRAQLALLNGSVLLSEMSWESKRNEIKKLLPNIEKLLKKNGRAFKDLQKIVVVRGPGPYGGLRIASTVANILGLTTGAKLFELTKEDLDVTREPKSLGEQLSNGLKPRSTKIIAPKYLKPPSITKPKRLPHLSSTRFSQ